MTFVAAASMQASAHGSDNEDRPLKEGPEAVSGPFFLSYSNGMTGASADRITAHADALVQQGRISDAYSMLEREALAGHGPAAMHLAQWRLSGQIIRRDLGLARQYYGLAAKSGIAQAFDIYVALLASGAGGQSRDWSNALSLLAQRAGEDSVAARQSDLLAVMDINEDGDPRGRWQAETLCANAPFVRRFEHFLTEAECGYLVDKALPMLQPAVVVDPQSGQFIADPVRRSRSAAFPFILEDPVIHAINRRIARITATDYDQGEPLQLLCYQSGDEYRLHSDTLPVGHNQRTDTFLICLSTGFEGGATVFPRAALSWRGAIGEALHFRNVDTSGAPDPLAWHAGEPVTQGVKYMLSKWIRHEPLDISGPPGRPF